MRYVTWLSRSAILGACALAFTACSEDDGDDIGNGQVAGGGPVGTSGSGGGSGSGTAGATFGGAPGGSGSGAGAATGTAGFSSGTAGMTGRPVIECMGLPFEEPDDAEEACVGIGLEAEPLPADLFIMMDRSISMGEFLPGTEITRWEALRDAVSEFAEATGAQNVRAGIGFFGRTGGRNDALDCSVDYYATPIVEIGPLEDVGTDLVAAIEDQVPSGLTPTLPALQGALGYAQEYQNANPERATSVVLVTDGYPTQCQSVASISEIAAAAEAAYTAEPYIRTFVVGLAAGFNLDSIARAGGTNSAFLVDEGNVTESFVQTLKNITNSPVPCEFEIPEAPTEGMRIDTEKVQVTYAPAAGDEEEVPRVSSSEACGRNPNGGWYYNNNDEPSTIRVCPCTCSRFGAGRVDIRLGCSPRIGIR